MNRCGDGRCVQQAHRVPSVPSNLRHGMPPEWPIPDRLDPGYDQPGPPRRSDLSWQLVIEAFVVCAAIALFIVLASLVAVE